MKLNKLRQLHRSLFCFRVSHNMNSIIKPFMPRLTLSGNDTPAIS